MQLPREIKQGFVREDLWKFEFPPKVGDKFRLQIDFNFPLYLNLPPTSAEQDRLYQEILQDSIDFPDLVGDPDQCLSEIINETTDGCIAWGKVTNIITDKCFEAVLDVGSENTPLYYVYGAKVVIIYDESYANPWILHRFNK